MIWSIKVGSGTLLYHNGMVDETKKMKAREMHVVNTYYIRCTKIWTHCQTNKTILPLTGWCRCNWGLVSEKRKKTLSSLSFFTLLGPSTLHAAYTSPTCLELVIKKIFCLNWFRFCPSIVSLSLSEPRKGFPGIHSFTINVVINGCVYFIRSLKCVSTISSELRLSLTKRLVWDASCMTAHPYLFFLVPWAQVPVSMALVSLGKLSWVRIPVISILAYNLVHGFIFSGNG